MAQLPPSHLPPVLEPESAYAEKLRSLSKYITPVIGLIEHVAAENKDNGKAKEIDRLQNLLKILQNERKVNMEFLGRCEDALKKMEGDHRFMKMLHDTQSPPRLSKIFDCGLCSPSFSSTCAITMINHKINCGPFVMKKQLENWDSFTKARFDARYNKKAKVGDLEPTFEGLLETGDDSSQILPVMVPHRCEGCGVETIYERTLLDHKVNCDDFLLRQILQAWRENSEEYFRADKRKSHASTKVKKEL